MKNKQRGFIIPAMIVIVLILTISGGSYVYLENKKIEFKEETQIVDVATTTDTATYPVVTEDNTDESTIATSTTSAVPTVAKIKTENNSNINSDIQIVSDLMKKYKIAYESGNYKVVKSFFSKETLDFFDKIGAESYITTGSKITIGKITRSGKNIRAETVETKNNGSKEDQVYVFILEDGQWKIDMNASFESDMQKSETSQGDQNGYIDLVVTEIKVYPSHPIVNDENVEIAVTIKNIGTKASEKGAPAFADILENTDYTPTQGGSVGLLGAGESVVWKYHMYSQNKSFNRSDVAGKKTVKVDLNGYKDVVEKNYTNNSFIYNFEVFDK